MATKRASTWPAVSLRGLLFRLRYQFEAICLALSSNWVPVCPPGLPAAKPCMRWGCVLAVRECETK